MVVAGRAFGVEDEDTPVAEEDTLVVEETDNITAAVDTAGRKSRNPGKSIGFQGQGRHGDQTLIILPVPSSRS
jgi:hypothetical protein